MALRSARSYDTDVVSYMSSLSFAGVPNRARQSFRDECDINVMVSRFQRTGVPPAPPSPPVPADFDQVFDFQSAMQTVVDAQRSFAALPSKLRSRFGNDPQQFLAFVYDDSNRDEAVRLGLVPAPEPVPARAPVPPVVGVPRSDSSSDDSSMS